MQILTTMIFCDKTSHDVFKECKTLLSFPFSPQLRNFQEYIKSISVPGENAHKVLCSLVWNYFVL